MDKTCESDKADQEKYRSIAIETFGLETVLAFDKFFFEFQDLRITCEHNFEFFKKVKEIYGDDGDQIVGALLYGMKMGELGALYHLKLKETEICDVSMRKQELKKVPIGSLVPYTKEIHTTTKSVAAIARSLQRHGYVKISIVVDEQLEIICGQGVVKAMEKLGWESVPEVTQVIGMPPSIKREYRIADNQTGSKSRWDIEALLAEIEEIRNDNPEFEIADIAFDQQTLDQMKHDLEQDIKGEDDGFDPATVGESVIQRGDIFLLGPHRVMCLDATDQQDLQQLMDGKKAQMVFTDPPYNVDYEGATEEKLKIINDKMSAAEFYEFLLQAYQAMLASVQDGAPIYVCHADTETLNFRQAFIDAGWKLKQCIIWVKDQFVLGRQDYHWRHEPILQGRPAETSRKPAKKAAKGHQPILYGWKGGQAHRWFGGRDKDTVWEVPKPLRNAEHPTMKPIPLVVRAVQNSSVKDNIILDPFGGYGSTLMACEQTGRICYTGDLDPHYCQGIITRWEKYTGQSAERISTRQPAAATSRKRGATAG